MNLEEQINIMKSDIIKSVQEIVRIKSVKSASEPGAPFGQGIGNALDYALGLASSMGFETRNIDGYVGYAQYGYGEEIVGVIGHLDVVPEGNGWTFGPYEARIHDNKIYGRGTIDDKGPIIAALYGLKAIKELGLHLNKRVRIIFGTDEENSWLDIDRYLKYETPPQAGFTADGMFPVINAEKGSIDLELHKDILRKSKGMIAVKSIEGGDAPNIVPDYCTCLIKLKEMAKLMLKDTLDLYCGKNNINMSMHRQDEDDIIISKGLPSHSSVPDKGKNAITQLIMFLSQFNLGQNDVADFIKFLWKYIGSSFDGKNMNINFTDEISGGLTLNLGQISIDEEKASAMLNIRYPVSVNYKDIIESIVKIADEKKIMVSVLRHKKPLYVDKESKLISTLMKCYENATGDKSYSIAIGGQTYAKAFDNMVAFGPVFPGEDVRAHMPNECICIDNLIKCARIYGRAIYELAR